MLRKVGLLLLWMQAAKSKKPISNYLRKLQTVNSRPNITSQNDQTNNKKVQE